MILLILISLLSIPVSAQTFQSWGDAKGDVFTWVSTQTWRPPSGMIVLVLSGTCPTGFTEVTALNGKMLRMTVAGNGDVGTTGGNATITPTGAVSAPTFTGSSATTSATSAGTPAGTNGTTTTGSTAITATATAAVAVTTGSGNSMATNAHTHPTHTHTVPAE